MNRWELWGTIDAAVRASFPDRAGAILSAIESRLEPGPWSAAAGGTRGEQSRDRVLADVERALRGAADEHEASAQLRELERWMRDSSLVSLQAHLALRHVISDWGTAIVDWAADALELGHDSPSLRMLAGMSRDVVSDVEERLDRVVRELGLGRDEVQELRAATRWLARETVQKRLAPHHASQFMYEIARELPPGNGDLEIWRHLTWGFDNDWSEHALDAYEREVIDAALAMLGAER